jgi:hypothetical protein
MADEFDMRQHRQTYGAFNRLLLWSAIGIVVVVASLMFWALR